MSFADDLTALGFELIQNDRSSQRYSLRSNPYLHWWVVAYTNGTAEIQWEFELGAYLKEKGFHIAVQDELSLLLYPNTEIRGPQDVEWVRAEIDRAAAQLGGIDLVHGT